MVLALLFLPAAAGAQALVHHHRKTLGQRQVRIGHALAKLQRQRHGDQFGQAGRQPYGYLARQRAARRGNGRNARVPAAPQDRSDRSDADPQRERRPRRDGGPACAAARINVGLYLAR